MHLSVLDFDIQPDSKSLVIVLDYTHQNINISQYLFLIIMYLLLKLNTAGCQPKKKKKKHTQMYCCSYYLSFDKFTLFLLSKGPREAASGVANIHIITPGNCKVHIQVVSLPPNNSTAAALSITSSKQHYSSCREAAE